jgi:hypothetical protein
LTFCVFQCCNAETEQGAAQAIIRSVIDFKRDPWPRVSDNAKDLVRGMHNAWTSCFFVLLTIRVAARISLLPTSVSGSYRFLAV